MKIKRKVYQKLLDWKKESNGTKALLIEGARRIGKSTVALEFAQNEYRSYIMIDFNIASKNVFEAFDHLNDLDVFFQKISLEYNTRLYERESLIIFDEIQKFPRAREAIKYLVQDQRYDYIEIGSLISLKENVNDITIPSEEKKIKMYPCDLEEFFTYLDEELLYEHIKESYRKGEALSDSLHHKAMYLFKEYLLVGGMPMALVSYKENHRDFYSADKEKRYILDLYRDDIKKAQKRYSSKVSALFENIPGSLSKHEKKIVLSDIDKHNNYFSNYDDQIFWLDDSMICNVAYKCNDPNVGFALTKDKSQVKCYMGDTGLLFSLTFSENQITSNELYKQIMNGKLSFNKGMLYENMIAQMISASGRKLYFYTRYNSKSHRNDIEIDFLLSSGDKTRFKVLPIEVKSNKNYSTTSLNIFKDLFKKRIGRSYIIHPKKYKDNFKDDKNIICLPPYYVPAFLEKLDNI